MFGVRVRTRGDVVLVFGLADAARRVLGTRVAYFETRTITRRTKGIRRMEGARESGRRRRQSTVLPIAEESLAVSRRVVPTATVRVKKIVRERIAKVDAPMVHEDVIVERVPVGRLVPGPIPPRRIGDTLVLSVVEEVLVKQLRLVEEVRITKRRRLERPRIIMPLRREEVVVERSQPAASPPRRARDA